MRASAKRRNLKNKLKELMEQSADPEALEHVLRRHMTELALIPKCNGTTRKGLPCTRSPIPGGSVCIFHGGAAPLVKAAAKQRLLAMTEPAFAVLMEVMEEGAEDEVRLKAAIAVLDRAGYGPRSTVVVDHRKEELASLTDAEIAERMKVLLNQMQENALPVIDVNVEEAIAAQKALPLPFIGVDSEQRAPLADPNPNRKSPSRTAGVISDTDSLEDR